MQRDPLELQHKSRITLQYRTQIDGVPATVNLPFRLLVLGDFSGGMNSPDRKESVPLERRSLRSIQGAGKTFDKVIEDMQIDVPLSVPNQLRAGGLGVGQGKQVDFTFRLRGMSDFLPESIVEQVGELKALSLFNTLLAEMQSWIDNNSQVRNTIRSIYQDPTTLNNIKEKLADYKSLILPRTSAKIELLERQEASASLDLGTVDAAKSAGFKTVITAKSAGVAGNQISVELVPDATLTADPTLDETTPNQIVVKYKPGTSTLDKVETALAKSKLVKIEKTQNPPPTPLDKVAFKAQLAGGVDAVSAPTFTAAPTVGDTLALDGGADGPTSWKGATFTITSYDATAKTIMIDRPMEESDPIAAKITITAPDKTTTASPLDATVAVSIIDVPPPEIKTANKWDYNTTGANELVTTTRAVSLVPTSGFVAKPAIGDGFKSVNDDPTDQINRFLSAMAALVYNVEPDQDSLGKSRFHKSKVQQVIDRVQRLITKQVNAILHSTAVKDGKDYDPRTLQPNTSFQALEATWRSLADLVDDIDFASNVKLDILDVSWQELLDDFDNSSSDIFGGAFFKKVYTDEFDRYGGEPFGAFIGLYQFSFLPDHLSWLRGMGQISRASHAPFIAAVHPRFFQHEKAAEIEDILDIDGLLGHPRYSQWKSFREPEKPQDDVSAYIGLTFPRYILRLPYNPMTNPSKLLNFQEEAAGDSAKYLWGNSAILFARNLVRSFVNYGWCQYIRGIKGGGRISGLPVDSFEVRGQEELMLPVEIAIPDYREYEFARWGIIPLVGKKASGEATFFSVQSCKAPKEFKDPDDSKNSQLVTNLAYTFSICRIAHYIKAIMRDNIGSAADEKYIRDTLQQWLMGYVTTAVNPDLLTLRFYPFKAAEVTVTPREAEIGWYDATVKILPHIQFEGLKAVLMLESRLGKK